MVENYVMNSASAPLSLSVQRGGVIIAWAHANDDESAMDSLFMDGENTSICKNGRYRLHGACHGRF